MCWRHSESAPVAIHPNMGRYYRKQIASLREALNDDARRAEAVSLIRTSLTGSS